MNVLIRTLAGCAMAASLSACAGNWTDSPKNWERAFDEPQPADLKILHSVYWKASGVAPQYRYFFHAQSNASLIARFQASDDFREIQPTPGPVVTNICGRKPDWFLPKPPQNYRTWMTPNIRSGNMMVYEDRETHEIFLCDFMVMPDQRAQFE